MDCFMAVTSCVLYLLRLKRASARSGDDPIGGCRTEQDVSYVRIKYVHEQAQDRQPGHRAGHRHPSRRRREERQGEVRTRARRQPAWARVRLKQRLEAMRRFRALVVADAEHLAKVLSNEVGKPIAQARNELKGVLPRIDFFLAETAHALRTERVSRDGSMEERISHEPLGVVANISAWNYPWFVGANVFVPALLAAIRSSTSLRSSPR
jgi:acyl-CoA reductase-like NAD-dependent aldehyde dehydrogenase